MLQTCKGIISIPYVMCNLKLLAFLRIETFHQFLLLCSSDLTFLMLEKKSRGFSKTIKFNRCHFQTRNFNCTALEVTKLNFKTSACLFKTDFIRKLGNFNFQWTKTRIF